MMLTAKGEEADQLIGFTVGADDYVIKPFSVRVLLERLKALRRRTQPSAESTGTLSLDRGSPLIAVGIGP